MAANRATSSSCMSAPCQLAKAALTGPASSLTGAPARCRWSTGRQRRRWPRTRRTCRRPLCGSAPRLASWQRKADAPFARRAHQGHRLTDHPRRHLALCGHQRGRERGTGRATPACRVDGGRPLVRRSETIRAHTGRDVGGAQDRVRVARRRRSAMRWRPREARSRYVSTSAPLVFVDRPAVRLGHAGPAQRHPEHRPGARVGGPDVERGPDRRRKLDEWQRRPGQWRPRGRGRVPQRRQHRRPGGPRGQLVQHDRNALVRFGRGRPPDLGRWRDR